MSAWRIWQTSSVKLCFWTQVWVESVCLTAWFETMCHISAGSEQFSFISSWSSWFLPGSPSHCQLDVWWLVRLIVRLPFLTFLSSELITFWFWKHFPNLNITSPADFLLQLIMFQFFLLLTAPASKNKLVSNLYHLDS